MLTFGGEIKSMSDAEALETETVGGRHPVNHTITLVIISLFTANISLIICAKIYLTSCQIRHFKHNIVQVMLAVKGAPLYD